jgi:hypothetical protein
MAVRNTRARRNRSGRWQAGWSGEEWSAALFGAFTKFRKATIGYVMSVRLSVRMKCDIGVFYLPLTIDNSMFYCYSLWMDLPIPQHVAVLQFIHFDCCIS